MGVFRHEGARAETEGRMTIPIDAEWGQWTRAQMQNLRRHVYWREQRRWFQWP
jgi:hypothetical protein